MPTDYRKTLRDNLREAMRARRWSVKNPPPVVYTDGVKRGKRVAQRSIQNMLEQDGPSPSLDMLAAVAEALRLQPWELLVPDLSLTDRPALANARTIEAEVSRRVADQMQQLQGKVSALFGDERTGRPTHNHPHRQVPGEGEDGAY